MEQPSFNTWTTIFLFAAIQGLFVSMVFLFIKRENRIANALLALLIFLFSITLIEYVLYWTSFLYQFPHFMELSGGFPFLYGVILYLYFKRVFYGRGFGRKDLLHFAPFLLFIIYMFPKYLSAAEIKQQWLLGKMTFPSLHYWPSFIRNIKGLHWVKIIHMGQRFA